MSEPTEVAAGSRHATALLTAQHRALQSMIARLARERRRSLSLVQTLWVTLGAHIETERELFYPAVRQLDRALIAAGYDEHAATRAALDRLTTAAPSGRALDPLLARLAHVFDDHVQEDEEELFPKAERALGARSFALAARMSLRFDGLTRRALEPDGGASQEDGR